MLASLEEIPGVREARVHHDGVYFLFALESDTAAFDVLEGARELLPDARRPPSGTETELVASFLRGETWLRSSDTVERCKAFLDAREVARLEEYLTAMLSR